MLFTLYEALRQIDPHVVLDDGVTPRTVEQLIFSADMNSSMEYAIGVDSLERLVIFEIDAHGFAIFPAAFVEKKQSSPAVSAEEGFRSTVTGNFLPPMS